MDRIFLEPGCIVSWHRLLRRTLRGSVRNQATEDLLFMSY